MLQPISLAFCGHLGNVELASVAMAISVSSHGGLHALSYKCVWVEETLSTLVEN